MGNKHRVIHNNELMHSDEFLGVDYSDGLKHWKYIKRYKGKNGKWQYVYADKHTHKTISNDFDSQKLFVKEASERLLNANKSKKNIHNNAIRLNDMKKSIRNTQDLLKYDEALKNDVELKKKYSNYKNEESRYKQYANIEYDKAQSTIENNRFGKNYRKIKETASYKLKDIHDSTIKIGESILETSEALTDLLHEIKERKYYKWY